MVCKRKEREPKLAVAPGPCGPRAAIFVLPLAIFTSRHLGWGLSLALATQVFGGYAPVPDLEKQRPLTVYASLGSYYDTNIFGAPRRATESWVFQAVPNLVYNASLNKRTFATLGYRLQWDHFENRPGKADQDSHRLSGKVAHTFSPRLEASWEGLAMRNRNPESLLPGVAEVLAEDQSSDTLASSAQATWAFTKRASALVKGQYTHLAYDADLLATELNRDEIWVHSAFRYLWSGRVLAVAEAKGQWVRYDDGGSFKDKESVYLTGGFDYSAAKTFSLLVRAGGQARQREEGTDYRPYGELGARWAYRGKSYLAYGYMLVTEEVANLALYNDLTVHRFFVNLRHQVTGRLAISGSLGWEPSRLNLRRAGGESVGETYHKAGLSASYQVNPRWEWVATWDYDDAQSDDANRRLYRNRWGIYSRWAF